MRTKRIVLSCSERRNLRRSLRKIDDADMRLRYLMALRADDGMEFCYTPKHGSWLNIAENKLSAMTRQCVEGRRFADIQTLRTETSAWSMDINKRQKGVNW